MYSGLLLLVIVGVWLAVLVPMALRSHDSSTALSSVDRFSDAMRVLARREQQGRAGARTFVLPPKPADSKPPVPLAVRRRRVLIGLTGTALVLLVLAVLGSMWALAGHLLADVLAATYVGHLRRQAIRKAERQVRAAGRAPARVRPRQVRIAGVPDRMPARPSPLAAPLPVPAARYEDPQPGTWEAPEFPVPTYVTAPVAPPRPTRVVDLTRPGRWSESLELDDAGLAILDEPDELDDILDGRRASGDW
ncbi:MAG: hypothetical protein JWN77_1954 [Frankiales bacterium]|nr:hypothetical protein [Frankiales bacterium]